jgi:multiple sugar transport system substrate-binding protein
MRKLSLLFVLALLVLATAVRAQDKTVISMVVGEWWYAEDSPGAALLQAYQEAHPEIEFDIRGVPFPELDGTQLASMESGQGPDIMIVNSVTVGSFIDRGYLLPMDDLIASNGLDTSMFYPGMYSSALMAGQVWGLPIDTGTRMLYWNKAMFEEAGIEPPTTWAELPEVALKMTDADNSVYGLVATSGERWVALYEHLGMYALANGLNFVNDEATECVLNQGDNVQIIQYWVDLFNSGVMSQDILLTGTGGEREQSFGNNVAAMYLGGHWSAATLEADYGMTYPEDYGIISLEGSDGSTASTTGGWIFTITRDSAHPQEAMDFIAWVLGDAENLVQFTTIMPSTEAATLITLKDEFFEPFKALMAQPNTRHPIPLNPGLPEQAEVIRNVFQSALLGDMTAQEAADSFCEQIEGTLFQ